MKHQDEDEKPETKGVTRRSFLKGAGLTAAGAAILDAGLAANADAQATATVKGPGASPLTLRINGVQKSVQAEPRTTLAEVLRESLNMTGTKVVCDRGACSACTVWMDGKTVNACMTFAFDAAGKEITTIEGLSKGGQLHPVQEAFVEHDALQCGFCTPGMVMQAAALLERKQNVSTEDVRDAVRGNLCRCGTYPKVFEATVAASKRRAAGAGTKRG